MAAVAALGIAKPNAAHGPEGVRPRRVQRCEKRDDPVTDQRRQRLWLWIPRPLRVPHVLGHIAHPMREQTAHEGSPGHSTHPIASGGDDHRQRCLQVPLTTVAGNGYAGLLTRLLRDASVQRGRHVTMWHDADSPSVPRVTTVLLGPTRLAAVESVPMRTTNRPTARNTLRR